MNRADVHDPHFHYLAAVCHLAAEDYPAVLNAAGRVSALMKGQNTNGQGFQLGVESAYLMGWAHLLGKDYPAAVGAFKFPAQTPNSPSAAHARALLGNLHFALAQFDDAIAWWNAVSAEHRAAWKLDDPLRGTVFLSALQALQQGRYEQAAEKLREAGRLGLRDRRLGPLLTLALVKAGQQLLY
jgi:TolA-binding protein